MEVKQAFFYFVPHQVQQGCNRGNIKFTPVSDIVEVLVQPLIVESSGCCYSYKGQVTEIEEQEKQKKSEGKFPACGWLRFYAF